MPNLYVWKTTFYFPFFVIKDILVMFEESSAQSCNQSSSQTTYLTYWDDFIDLTDLKGKKLCNKLSILPKQSINIDVSYNIYQIIWSRYINYIIFIQLPNIIMTFTSKLCKI